MTRIVINLRLQGPYSDGNRPPRQAVSVISKGKNAPVLPPAAHTRATTNLAEGRCTASEGRFLAGRGRCKANFAAGYPARAV